MEYLSLYKTNIEKYVRDARVGAAGGFGRSVNPMYVFGPGGQILPAILLLAPPDFWTMLRLCNSM